MGTASEQEQMKGDHDRVRGCIITSALLMKDGIILCCRDLLVFKDLLANKEKKERGDPGVNLVLLAPLDHLERE